MRSPRPHAYEINLIPVWDRWVVEVPEAGGVHVMITDIGDAEHAARGAIATFLGIDLEDVEVVRRIS